MNPSAALFRARRRMRQNGGLIMWLRGSNQLVEQSLGAEAIAELIADRVGASVPEVLIAPPLVFATPTPPPTPIAEGGDGRAPTPLPTPPRRQWERPRTRRDHDARW